MNDVNPPSASDELFWLAVRYAGNDLSDAERTAFEERLATEVEACIAVAEAVRLTSGMQAALMEAPQLAPVASTSLAMTRRRSVWGPVALCAALMLATGSLMIFWQAPRSTPIEVATAELLSRWRIDGRLGTMEEYESDDDAEGESEIIDESLSAPGWLVSAVRLTAESSSNSP